MIFKSIVGKLWIAIVFLFILVLSGLGIFLNQMFDDFYMDLQTNNLTTKAHQIAQIYQKEKNQELAMDKIQLLLDDSNAHAMITDPEGLVRGCSPRMPKFGMARLDAEDVRKLQQGQIVVNQRDNRLGTKMLSVAVPIQSDEKLKMAVLVWSPLETITATKNQIKERIIISAIGGILLATFLSFFLSKKISRPLLEMNIVASQMRRKNFDGKVTNLTDDEIGRLGNTLNVLSEELKETLGALSNEKDQLSNILASMTDGVITCSSTGEIITMNPKAAGLFEFDNNLPIGEKIDDCCPVGEIKDIFYTVLNSGLAQVRQVKWRDQVLSVRMAPLKDHINQVRGVVSVVQDITKEYQLEKMRKDFVANVSHELRNPLFLLQGYGEALLHDVAENKEDRDEIIRIIVDETLRLQRLVNDILDLATLESDKFKLNKEAIAIQEIMAGMVKRYQPLADERKIELNLKLPSDLTTLSIDPDRITQVFINLLDNAFRFTGEGGQVNIDTNIAGGSIIVSVTDNGQGIPEDELPYIWERFYKVEKSRNRKSGGTGLGLAIVKKIVEAHGGNVSITSKYGQGTTVTFNIPLE